MFVVADGMGGHDGGDVASSIVVEEFGRLAEAGYDPRHAVDAVREALAPARPGSGSTPRCSAGAASIAAGTRARRW